MCLGVPMKVLSLESPTTARAEIMGLTRIIRIDLLPETNPGDYVLVHAGFALQTVSPGEARDQFSRLAEAMDGAGDADDEPR